MGMGLIQAFFADEAGAAALDYGFFVAFVAAALLIGAENLAASVEDLFNTVSDAVNDSLSNPID